MVIFGFEVVFIVHSPYLKDIVIASVLFCVFLFFPFAPLPSSFPANFLLKTVGETSSPQDRSESSCEGRIVVK